MLSINNLSYFIGGRALYENASLHIKPKDKIGLVGLNGTGKSTLLRLIAGEYQPDAGSISKSNECSIGFLNQDLLSYQSNDPIKLVAMQAFEEALRVEAQIEKVLQEMETNYHDALVNKLTRLQEKFEAMEGYTLQAKAEEVLEGIGFNSQDLERPLKEFSGGWRMRVMLAKLLLEKPNLLMLDEPTNHLDLPSIEWIEQYLRSYEGAVIIVSHDRRFLDNAVESIVEVSQRQLTSYQGNYSFFLQEKQLRNEIQQNAYENQQQKIKQTERFVERFRAKATKARQVQSKIKSLERMDLIDEVVNENATVNFAFTFKQKSGRFVITLDNISKAYGPKTILTHTTARIERGDKIALIGANGKGKSTLLRIIAGTEGIEGKRELGYNVNTGFYAQHQLEALNTGNEILEELKQAGTEKTEQELRGVLGCFLFRDEDVFKKIKVLSGGEKSRVALAKTLIGESNFLMLDEPTNHLDMQSVNILSQALQQYQGTFVVVSHDRQFIAEIATKIWYIEGHEIKEYPGTYQEYQYWLAQRLGMDDKEAARHDAKAERAEKNVAAKQKKQQKVATPTPPDRKKEQQAKKLKKEVEALEEEILTLEEAIETTEGRLAQPEVFEDPEKLNAVNLEYQQQKEALEKLTAQWEAKTEALEAL